MESITQLLDRKGRATWSVEPNQQVFEAIRLMADKGVGALLVRDADGQLVGIVSERDYARKVILQDKSSKSTAVADIMSTELVTVTPHRSIQECLTLMTENRIRHLPVVENMQLIGILSIGDLVKSVIDDQRHQIESLEQYISGQ